MRYITLNPPTPAHPGQVRIRPLRAVALMAVSTILLSVLLTIFIANTYLDGLQPGHLILALIPPLVFSGLFAIYVFSHAAGLRKAYQEFSRLSVQDELTGAATPNYFMKRLNEEVLRYLRSGRSFSAVLFDIDGFREVNERYGHFAGDRVLQQLADTCLRGTRGSDIFARLGGDEFGFILPEMDEKACRLFTARIHKLLTASPFQAGGAEVLLRISVTCGTWNEEFDDLEAFLYALDHALHTAKISGGNCMIHAKVQPEPAGAV